MIRGALTPELTETTVYGQYAVRRAQRNAGRVSERGRHAIFTVFPSKSSSVNRNVYVG